MNIYLIVDLNDGRTLAVVKADGLFEAIGAYQSNFGYRINIKAERYL